MKIEKIISGGQTGVDRSALDFAINHNIPAGGWCPKGRKAEDGTIPEKYPLKETNSRKNHKRTEQNVTDSNGTLIITCNNTLVEGTKLTEEYCQKHNKPCIIIDVSHTKIVMKNRFKKWLNDYNIKTLNVAGNKESECKGIYNKTTEILEFILGYTDPNQQ